MQTYEHTLAETVFAFKIYIDGHFRFSPFFLLLELLKENNEKKSAKQVNQRTNKLRQEIEAGTVADLSAFQLLVMVGDRCSSLRVLWLCPLSCVRCRSSAVHPINLLLVKARYLSVFPAFWHITCRPMSACFILCWLFDNNMAYHPLGSFCIIFSNIIWSKPVITGMCGGRRRNVGE